MENYFTHSLHWILLAGAIWVLSFVMIPFYFLKKVWLPALITGFIMTYFINFPAVGYLRLWRFSPVALTVLHTPLFLALAWYGSIMVFDYLVLVYSRFKIPLIFLFSLLTMLIFWDASWEGHLHLHNWSYFETFFLAVITHGISILILKLFTKEDKLKPNDNPLGIR